MSPPNLSIRGYAASAFGLLMVVLVACTGLALHDRGPVLVPGERMRKPGFPHLTEPERRSIALYVISMGRQSPQNEKGEFSHDD